MSCRIENRNDRRATCWTTRSSTFSKENLMMKCILICGIILGVVVRSTSFSQDTFSIVAVDLSTGEIGSAGASCGPAASRVSDLHPGIGAIHTQGVYHSTNQVYGNMLMRRGLSPQEIIDSLVARDVEGTPNLRQYGIVKLAGGGRSAAYTGADCPADKSHIIGSEDWYYAIQGNFLLGPEIVFNMQSGFLNSNGSLTDRLIAALQGAKVPGADKQCQPLGKSSISAFIRTARPQDTTGTLYLDLSVDDTPTAVDPIDSLQQLYDIWKLATGVPGISEEIPTTYSLTQNFPNPFNPSTIIRYQLPTDNYVSLKVYDVLGSEVAVLVDEKQSAGTQEVTWNASVLGSGLYFYRIQASGEHGTSFVETRKMILLR